MPEPSVIRTLVLHGSKLSYTSSSSMDYCRCDRSYESMYVRVHHKRNKILVTFCTSASPFLFL